MVNNSSKEHMNSNFEKNFKKWNQKKQQIETRDIDELNLYFSPREIWWCSLGVNIGSESCGKHDSFERPVLILKKYGKHSALVIPETTQFKKGELFHAYKYDKQVFYLLLGQSRVVSTKRLLRKIRHLDKTNFYQTKAKYAQLVLSE